MVTKIEDGEDLKMVQRGGPPGMMPAGMQMAAPMQRPPSTSSVPGSAGARSTTITSRRGGRTRARSPAVMGGRTATPSSGGEGAMGGGGVDNPSSAAAAAAAAAAKVGNAPWSDRDRRSDDPKYARGPYGGGPNKWPQQDDYGASSSSTASQQQQHHRGRYGPYDPATGYPRGGPFRTPEDGGNGSYPDRRYRDAHHRSGGRPPYDGDPGSRGPSRGSGYYPSSNDYRYNPHHHPHHPHHPPPPPHPHHQGGRDYRGGGSASTPKRSSGGNHLVIGGSTPIHVPKTPGGDTPSSASGRTSRGGSAASVFRGRPGEERDKSSGAAGAAAAGSSGANDDGDENSPQKILLSLRTPTMSFDDSGGGKEKSKSGLSLSPDGPPNIQNASSHQRSDQLFERGEENKAGIDMASSFNLFNQSFDSFGGDYFNVESSLQNDSFGIGRAGSTENDMGNTQILQGSPSAGNFSATQLLAPSASANLSIGYSPVNSFGNPSAGAGSHHRGESMMVLGGNDQRSASPSQMFGMYRSYSGAGGGPDGSPQKMGGSFGGPHGRPHGGEHGGSPPNNAYYYGGPRMHEGGTDRNPSFYSFLIRHKGAFLDCTFLLPGLKAAISDAVKPEQSPYGPYAEPPLKDTVVARRRVESSVCAFGGNIQQSRSKTDESKPHGNSSATVTPSSSVASPPRPTSKSRKKYEADLPGRYYENESRLSWEFEENPPVVVEHSSDKEDGSSASFNDKNDSDSKDSKGSGDEYCKPVGSDSYGKKSPSPQSKTRYRCKLCGQPKQNHTCPYQQSLARSIGINVYPTVNAFAAAEPGTIAPPLSEMNNFIEVHKEGGSADSSPSRPASASITSMPQTNQVTPNSLRSTGSPSQSMSPSSVASPVSSRTPTRGNGSGRRSKKRSRSQAEPQTDALFAEPMEIKGEQFRTVTPLEPASSGQELFRYPALPLPYAQRKKLSDNLFSLSNDVPKLTDECAQVLREAREKDMWDLAVAELMTQVVVVIHCAEGDHRFEGLRQYLLTLGIAS